MLELHNVHHVHLAQAIQLLQLQRIVRIVMLGFIQMRKEVSRAKKLFVVTLQIPWVQLLNNHVHQGATTMVHSLPLVLYAQLVHFNQSLLSLIAHHVNVGNIPTDRELRNVLHVHLDVLVMHLVVLIVPVVQLGLQQKMAKLVSTV